MDKNNKNLENNDGLDAIDWQLLEALQNEARLSFSELGRRVNLSQPAVAERVRRLENAGIISGYHAHINLKTIGFSVLAVIRLVIAGDTQPFVDQLSTMPEIYECLIVTGEDCFMLRARLTSIDALHVLTKRLKRFGRTTTSIVMATPLERRAVTSAG